MRLFGWLSEQSLFGSTLRSLSRIVSTTFFPSQPAYDGTKVNAELARQLYRNDGADTHLGAGFCRPIIDTSVNFIGIPIIASTDEATDEFLNRAMNDVWAPKIVEMLRNSMRDSLTIVRVWQPPATDPLVTDDEREMCELMIYEPERVTMTFDPRNPSRCTQAIIVTQVEMPDPVQPAVDPQRGAKPQVKTHEIWEIITPDLYRYYDKTDAQWLTSWQRANTVGFVPMVEVFNEYDSSLSGGQSDLEGSYPFIRAFHEALLQALKAHRYHSIPKLKFQVGDINQFLASNFPDTIDPDTGTPIPGAAINWQGREVLIMGQEDDLGFIEMKSALGDSKAILEFLIDCIAISSETPEWAFMRVEGGTSSGAVSGQTEPFEKKIERKRAQFQEPVQLIVKMAMAMTGKQPERVEITWDETRVQNILAMSQAVQQFVMSLEVLLERKLISDNTARESLRVFRMFRKMKPPIQEEKDAQKNFDLGAHTAEVQAKNQPALPPGFPSNGNPNGSKTAKPQIPTGN